MRKLLGRIIRWFIHEHDKEDVERVISRREVVKVTGEGKKKRTEWVKASENNWVDIWYVQRCKTCGRKTIVHFNNSHEPK